MSAISPIRLLLLPLLLACAAPDRSDQRAAAADAAQPSAQALSTPAAAQCDSVGDFMRQALQLTAARENGMFTDARGVQRTGCRFTARGSFEALADQAGPVAALERTFVQRGWRADLRYSADGPDGSVIGMRKLEQLCVIYGSWDGGDDSDTTSVNADVSPSYDVAIECSRDVPDNADADVPDSLWQAAARAGLDRDYAISMSLQYPPYLEGDYDGDGVGDAAVLVEHRASGRLGIAIVRRGAQQVAILGAGASGSGPADLGWIDAWEVFPKGTTMHLTIGDRPRTPLAGDALWVGRRDSISSFYVWDGQRFIYEEHARQAGASLSK